MQKEPEHYGRARYAKEGPAGNINFNTRRKVEPEYYGDARYVNEGPANFPHLDNLTYPELDSIAYQAAQRRDHVLKRAALDRMSKRYLESVIEWVKSVDERKPDLGDVDYLEQCNEILRIGLNNEFKKVLTYIWPVIKEKANILAINSRLMPNCPTRRRYVEYREATDIFVDSRLEMMRHG